MSELTATMYGLASAVTWGAGDFYGGFASRKADVLRVVILSQTIGLALMFVAAVIVNEPLISLTDLFWSMAAGASSGWGLILYYAALARGSMTAVAPITGVLAAVVPAVTGAFIEGPPSLFQAIGFVFAFVSIGLVTGLEPRKLRADTQLLFAILGGTSFGMFLVLIGQVSEGSSLYPLAFSRITTIALAFTIATATKPLKPLRKGLGFATAAGVFDALGSLFYLLARHEGRLDVAAVLSSLYPISTVVIAKLLLKETLGRKRTTGILFAAIATVLINTSTI
ncbi:MAG: EamA family transporter [Candidatus Caldarchaeum sp.]